MDSIWTTTTFSPDFPVLEGDKKTDILIIGGGITGILCAWFLQKQNVPYILVEANKLCSQTTAYTTAKLTVQHGLIYHKLAKSIGLHKAGLYLKAQTESLHLFEALCQSIDCDYERKDNYIYSSSYSDLEQEMRTLELLHFPASFCSHIDPPVSCEGAVMFPDQAQFHPLKFLFYLCKGLHIYEHTKVLSLQGKTAVTNRGKIRAKQIITATHFPFWNKHGLYFMKLYQHRSYVLGISNAPSYPGMYMSDEKNGFSFRNAGDILLLGGGAHRTGKTGGGPDVLRHFSREHFPCAKPVYTWATQDCMPLDNRPYIGPYSYFSQGLFCASGFGKWGMTNAMTAARILTDQVLGKSNPYQDLFSPSRHMFHLQLFQNLMESSRNLLTFRTPRCPHLGCGLKWNKEEHSYDCPCHGSRFSEDGILLHNPALHDFSPDQKKKHCKHRKI